jgi:hypothetical protein
MKTLWVNTNFMHPTTKGGQIRTLEMLRQLHRRHEIHYVAIEKAAEPENTRSTRIRSSTASAPGTRRSSLARRSRACSRRFRSPWSASILRACAHFSKS